MSNNNNNNNNNNNDVRGILRTNGTPKKTQKPGVSWDEDNLLFNETESVNYGNIKIDEPDTPYNYDTYSDEDDMMKDDPNELAEKLAELQELEDDDEIYDDNDDNNENSDDDENNDDKKARILFNEDEDDDDDDLDEEAKIKKKQFELKRKQHYDEFLRVKEFKQKGALD
eukprot:TRINITY_DN336_c7_g1_i1.p1 TRINITY_DN336_c7_g1~~TRINITY_DN336_c7_g1_i1.p1  ORF type:complete len:170 (-),score=96.28 TRINITY_DN336_c7_g1_i1:135-644(-)